MAKKIPRELEVLVVGLRHRVTHSTRVILEERTHKGVISARIEREPDNREDDNAIKVIISDAPYKGMHIGYIPRIVAAVMAPAIDDGTIDISTAEGSIVDVDPGEGTATMHLKFKAGLTIKPAKKMQKGGKRKTKKA